MMNHRDDGFCQRPPIPGRLNRVNAAVEQSARQFVKEKITSAEIIYSNRQSRSPPKYPALFDCPRYISPHSESPIVESNPAPWYPGVFGQSRSEFQFDTKINVSFTVMYWRKGHFLLNKRRRNHGLPRPRGRRSCTMPWQEFGIVFDAARQGVEE
jgi:hypothetical protein